MVLKIISRCMFLKHNSYAFILGVTLVYFTNMLFANDFFLRIIALLL